MAIYIPIFKESEDDHMVVYTYAREWWERDPLQGGKRTLLSEMGRIGIDKQTGEVVPLVELAEDAFYLPRAMIKLREAAAKRKYPERLDYMA